MLEYIDKKEYEKAAEILLLKYYDPLYGHTLNRMDFKATINSDDVDQAVKKIKEYIEKWKIIVDFHDKYLKKIIFPSSKE